MLFILKKILSALVLPPASLIILALVGLWLTSKHQRTGKTITALALTTLLILSLPVTGNALIRSLETSSPISEAQLKEIQAIVILGGGRNTDAPEYGGVDTVNSLTLERLRYGANLQQKTGKPILVSGGAPFGGRSVADAMAETLTDDFHAQTVWIEDKSNDTSENASFSTKTLKQHSITHIALVSQAWHLTRAIPLFEKQGLKVSPAGTGYSTDKTNLVTTWLPAAGALEESSMAIKEYLGTLLSK